MKILIAPPSPRFPGSRGDQAVILATQYELKARGGSVVVAVPDIANPEWGFLRDEGIRAMPMEKIPVDRLDAVVCLGTDVFDGAYSPKDTQSIEAITRAFLHRGKSASVIGISVRPDVQPGVRAIMAQMARHVRITVRDPVSFARFVEFQPERAPILVADPAFLLRPSPVPGDVLDWIRQQKNRGLRCIGLNVNGHLAELQDDILPTLTRVLGDCSDVAVALVPHDSRPAAGDTRACQALFQRLEPRLGDRVRLLPLYSAREVKGLAGQLDGVVTGRMHFAIASLGQAVPVLGIDYNFKMKGLFSYFGTQDFVADAGSLPDKLEGFLRQLPRLRHLISERLPRVRDLARRNFDFGYVPDVSRSYENARFQAWSGAEHRPKWPNPVASESAVSRANLSAMLAIDLHRIEKGLALREPRRDFGQASGLIARLRGNLATYVSRYGADAMVRTAASALVAYARHAGMDELEADVAKMGDAIGAQEEWPAAGRRAVSRDEVLAQSKRDLGEFFASRASIRDFSDVPVEREAIDAAIKMAHDGTPSVCNRQPYRVHVLDGAARSMALELQNGNRGFGEQVDKVLLVTVDVQYFDGHTERNQPWIAGGLFAMSLIYALHSLGIASCALNWDVPPVMDARLRERLPVFDSEVVIMMIAVGNYPEQFSVATSSRLPLPDIVRSID